MDWWHRYTYKFLHLSLMTRDSLAIPATSVPSEQIFSVAGQILTKRRSALSENRMNVLMWCKNWLGYQELTQEELAIEQDLLSHIQEVGIDGDVVMAE